MEEENSGYYKTREQEAKVYGLNGCLCKACCLERFHKEWERAQNTDKYQNLIDYIQHAKETIKIKDIAQKRYGIKFYKNRCLCPFHPDTDPSFFIDELDNTFKCWSTNCNSQGDVIEFIEKMERLLDKQRNI